MMNVLPVFRTNTRADILAVLIEMCNNRVLQLRQQQQQPPLWTRLQPRLNDGAQIRVMKNIVLSLAQLYYCCCYEDLVTSMPAIGNVLQLMNTVKIVGVAANIANPLGQQDDLPHWRNLMNSLQHLINMPYAAKCMCSL